jgi:hypothetical protein
VTRVSTRPDPPPAPARVSPLPFVGMIGLACVLFLDLALVRAVPWWTTTVLVVLWVALLVVACLWWTPHPRRLPWLAAVAAGAWVVAVLGAALG